MYNKVTLSQTVFDEFCLLRTKSNERGRDGGSKTVVNKYANFLSLTFSKVFTRQGIALVIIMINVSVMVTLTYIEFIKKNICCRQNPS